MRHFRNSIFFLFLLASMAATGLGQTNPGSITGVVKDARDTPIPGVTVQAQNAETGVKGQSVTNDAGVFRIEALVTGQLQPAGGIARVHKVQSKFNRSAGRTNL